MKSYVYLALLTLNGIFVSLESDSKIIKYVCVLLLMIFLLKKNILSIQKNYIKINWALYLFSFAILLSSFNMIFLDLPLDFHRVSPLSGVLFVLCVIDMFWLLEYLSITNKIYPFCRSLYKLMCIYIIVNDIVLLKQMPAISGMSSSSIHYIVGNKFEVVYLHYFFTALYYFLNCTNQNTFLQKRCIYTLHILLCMVISVFVECTTGLLGALTLGVSILLYHKISFLFKPQILISILLLIGSFFFLYEEILAIPFVQYIVVDILNEDLTLTGRTIIYEKMMDLLYMEPWLGYGNGTATFFTTYHINDALTNTQNGLLNDFIEWGFVGVSCFLLLIYIAFKNRFTSIDYKNPFICLLFTYIILSCIEITLGLRFLVVLPFCLLTQQSLKKIITHRKQTTY